MVLDSYDSGLGIEDIVREELRQLLPRRYAVAPGVISDRHGRTGGEVDIAVFNDFWFPTLKAAATQNSRRSYLPIEGVYAVLEVKQSLGYSELDSAMEKLVTCHRLTRPPTSRWRIVENWEIEECEHGTTNPLFSAIIATDIKAGVRMERLIDRFYDINRTLKRREVVHYLCILGEGSAGWSYIAKDGSRKPALFRNDDLYQPIMPVFHKVGDGPGDFQSAFYPFMQSLMTHLYNSILGAEDVSAFYGDLNRKPLFPDSPEICLEPDETDRRVREFTDEVLSSIGSAHMPKSTRLVNQMPSRRARKRNNRRGR